jgi:hypothetical protein
MKKTMKKTIITALTMLLLVGVAIVLPLSAAHAFETFLGETETRLYKPDKSYNGYFMPTEGSNGAGTKYLMDLWGNVVHIWQSKNGTAQIAPDGTLWSIGYIQDWDSNVLWSFDPATDGASIPVVNSTVFTLHHDLKRIWNKKLNQWTMLINCNRPMTQAEAVAMGMDPSVTYGNRLTGIDFVIEVNMAKQIVWQWYPWNHGCQSKNSAWPNYVSDVKLAPGRLDVNWLTDNQRPSGTAGIVSDWFHVNSIDYNEDLDQVVINEKHWSQFVVVDHGKTFVSTTDFTKNAAAAAGPDGDFIYRFGAPDSYNSGKVPGFATEGDNQMYGAHNIQWIRNYHWDRPHLSTDKWPDPVGYTKSGVALPGAGHFLVFDNGCYNPAGKRSRIHEINGFIDAAGTDTGKYVDPAVAGYKTNPANLVYHQSRQLVWSYSSSQPNSFYSQAQSGCQRLPNGNTSICGTGSGHIFEVTTAGEVVWEYLWPGVAGTSVKFVGSDSNNAWQTDSDQYRGGVNPIAYRHYRYGADHPGLAGRDLTPIGTLTGRNPRLVGSTDTYPTPVTYTGFGFGAGAAAGGGGGVGAGTGGGSGGY